MFLMFVIMGLYGAVRGYLGMRSMRMWRDYRRALCHAWTSGPPMTGFMWGFVIHSVERGSGSHLV